MPTQKLVEKVTRTDQLTAEDLGPADSMLREIDSGINNILVQQKFFESRKTAQNEGKEENMMPSRSGI